METKKDISKFMECVKSSAQRRIYAWSDFIRKEESIKLMI